MHSQMERGMVIGGYRIDELISRGALGLVYRTTHVALNRIYALKLLAPELSDDDQFRDGSSGRSGLPRPSTTPT